MAFTMRCGKCHGTNLDLHKEGTQGFGWRSKILYVELHCNTCGWTVAGKDRVEAEYDRQKADWDAEQARKKAEARRQRKAELERIRREQEAERIRLEAEAAKAAEKLANQCAWAECENERRESSIYCSRNCSNKNARHRHRERQKAKQAA